MVRVDDVYQKVLALANKEQRGYITPQDFNLFANQAQMEIFEQYFYDTNVARKNQGNDTVVADIDDMLEQKLQEFHESWLSNGSNTFPFNEAYRISGVFIGDPSNPAELRSCEILDPKDLLAAMLQSPLLAPTADLPIATIRGNAVTAFSSTSSSGNEATIIIYIRAPRRVNWTYVVINKQAMYDANGTTQHFEVHASEENQLINKILMLSGLANRQPDLMKAGQGMEMVTTQKQPKI